MSLRKDTKNFFAFFRHREDNLQKFQAEKTCQYEVTMLTLNYLESLASSAGPILGKKRPHIGDFIDRFYTKDNFPKRVSTRALYGFSKWYLKISTQGALKKKTIKKQLEEHFWQTNQIGKFLINIDRCTGNNKRLLFSAIEKFSYEKLDNAATGNGYFKTTSVDVESNKLLVEFESFLMHGPANILVALGNKKKRNPFKPLMSHFPRHELLDLFGFFSFAEIIKRDYRDPLAHRAEHQAGTELDQNIPEPYYWWNAINWNNPRRRQSLLNLGISSEFFVKMLHTCLVEYEKYCLKNNHDPVPEAVRKYEDIFLKSFSHH